MMQNPCVYYIITFFYYIMLSRTIMLEIRLDIYYISVYLPILLIGVVNCKESLCRSDQFVNCNIAEYETEVSDNDFEQVKSNPGYLNDPMQNKAWDSQDHFEGDILGHSDYSIDSLVSLTYELSKPKPENAAKSAAITDPYKLWNEGIIPYKISSQFTERGRQVIAAAIDEYHNKTCIKFIPRTAERDYVYLHPNSWGCASFVGRQKGMQAVDLGRGCVTKGTVLHELMHTVGFFHEQSRSDRDYYVDIYLQNTKKGFQGQFKKYDLTKITHLNTPYDYESIMHYSMYAFSRQSGTLPTIVPKDKRYKIGQRNKFSSVDIEEINRLYQCPESNAVKQTIPILCEDGHWMDCLLNQEHSGPSTNTGGSMDLNIFNSIIDIDRTQQDNPGNLGVTVSGSGHSAGLFVILVLYILL